MAASKAGNGHAQEVALEAVKTDSPADIRQSLEADARRFMDNVATFRQRDETARSTLHNTTSVTAAPAGNGAAAGAANGAAAAGLPQGRSFVRLTQVLRVTLEWRNLTYNITVGRRKARTAKHILAGLSAQVPAGRLLAVMGPTGCGKTSLVNALAGRLQAGGELHGQVLVNTLPRGRGFRSISSYVMQDDVLFGNLTVRETFAFAARMRLPADVSVDTKEALVDQIIGELGLAKAAHTRIGNNFVRGVSGGERKRTNIGIELLSGASLVFLDEPTSGLDAFQAQSVVECLRMLASNGRTVVTTIHQPRSSIYKMFDLLLLLSEGREMYCGPAEDATAWFAAAGYPCPALFNPADFFLDVVSVDYRSPEAEAASRERVQLLGDLFSREGAALAPHKEVPAANVADMQHVNEAVAFPNNLPTEFGLLLARAWKQQSRDKLPIAITLVQTTVIGFVLAAIYSGMDMSAIGIQDEIGILFFICIFSSFSPLLSSLLAFQTERAVVNRERAGKMYHVLPYYVARFMCDVPLRVGQGLLFGSIVYWIVGLNPSAAAFFIFCCILIVVGLTSQGLGVAVSAGSPNERVAMALAPALTIVLILFGGFYVNEGSIPVWLAWIRYISHLFYGFMALTINDFAGRYGWACEQPGEVPPECKTGDEIIVGLGFIPSRLWLGFVGMAALLVAFNFIGYVLLRRSKPKFMPLVEEEHPRKKTQ